MPARQRIKLELGQTVYSEDGHSLGTIRGVDENGLYVAAADHVTVPEPASRSTSVGAGEFDLMWRCLECGEVGRIEDIPEACPSCGASKEDLYYWTED